jgi:phosphoribosylamine--glycine ligase
VRVLVVGNGAREHALIWRLASSPSVTQLHAAPGNAGIRMSATCHPVDADDVRRIVSLVDHLDADLTVVGPESPLVAGLADELTARGRSVFGPGAAAARLEGSKAFAKDLMLRHGIPTARAGSFTDVEKAVAFLGELGDSAVVKADGLAAGKGVVVAEDRATAVAAIEACMIGDAFGSAGRTVVVEDVLRGVEVSAFALVDGEEVVPLALCQDFKRAADGDAGPNTGGMGAFAPLPFVEQATERSIWEDIVRATASAMVAEGIPYRGVLFAGVMLTTDGPEVLEFNCRFGDPETEALMPRLASDFGELLRDCAEGSLQGADATWRPEASVTVVLASGGYPGSYDTGVPIRGIDEAGDVDGVTVFHAGTAERDGTVVTAGGRVLAVSALGQSIAEARSRAYEACSRISFKGMQYRRDIAAGAAHDQTARADGREGS